MNRKKMLLALILIIGLIAIVLTGCMPDRVTVSFDVTGGQPISPIKIKADATVLELPTPQKTGYTFDYWCYDAELTQRVDVGNIPTEDITFYAKWSARLITVTFNGDPMQYRYVPYGGSLLVADMPEVRPVREGYTGRWLTSDLTNVTEPITIYSEYVLAVYSVTYFVNDEIHFTAEGAPGDAVSIPADPKVENRYFYGWYYDKDFTLPCAELPTVLPAEELALYARLIDVSDMARYLTYTVTGNEATVTGLSSLGKSQKTIVIPDSLGGYPVTSISEVSGADGYGTFVSDSLTTLAVPSTVKSVGNCAFFNLRTLSEVKIEEGLRHVGSYAFAGCAELTTILLPSSLETIGSYAFAGISTFNGSELEKLSVKLEKVAFGENSRLSTIGGYAFYNTENMTTFDLPDSEGYTFDYLAFDESYLSKFTSSSSKYATDNGAVYSSDFKTVYYMPLRKEGNLTVHEGTEKIANYAFYNSYNLNTVGIPASVKEIGDFAFSHCSALEEIVFADNSVLESIGKSAFAYSGLKSITLPSGVSALGKEVFLECAALETAYLPDTVETIPDYAFYACTSLTGFSLNSAVTSIGDYAFFKCTALSSYTFSSNSMLNEIGSHAFADCQSLSVLHLPTSLVTVKDYAFAGLESPIKLNLTVPRTIRQIGDYAFMNTLTTSATLTYVNSMGVGVFKNCTGLSRIAFSDTSGLTAIPDETFYNCISLTTITIPYTIKSLGKYAFYNCTSLATTVYSTSVGSRNLTSIGESCFENCTSLTNAGGTGRILPSTLTNLGEKAFKNCSSLSEITVPQNLKVISKEAFAYCESLTSILYDLNCVTDTLGENSFAYCTSLQVAALPSKLAYRDASHTLGAVKNPFFGCNRLTEFTIEDSDKFTVENGIVYTKNGNLRTVYLSPTGITGRFTVSANVSKIDDYAFYGAQLTELDFAFNAAVNGVESITLVNIGAYAFANSALNTLSLSKRVYRVSAYAFAFSQLRTLTVEVPLVSSNDIGFKLLNSSDATDNIMTIDKSAFRSTLLTQLFLPERVSTLNEGAFADCFNLTSVTFADGDICNLTIGDYAFSKNTALTELTFPARTVAIGERAFADCLNMEVIAFESAPGRSLAIGAYAFKSNHYLYSITLPGSLVSMGEGIFYDCSRLTEIVFPDSVADLEIPALAFYDCQSLYSVTVPSYVTSIGERAFLSSDIHIVTFLTDHDSAPLTVGASAFEETGYLTSVDFPSRLISLGEKAFYKSALKEYTADGARFTIGDYAFAYTKLTSVSFADGVSLSGSHIFADTPIKSAVFNQSEINVSPYAFFNSALENVTFDGSLVSVAEYAFAKTAFLNSVTALLADTAVIGEYAFDSSAITAFTISNLGTAKLSVLTGAFFNTYNLTQFTYSGDSFVAGDYAFAKSGITSLVLSGSADIGNGIAYSAINLETLEINDYNSVFSVTNGILYKNVDFNRILMQYPSGKRGAILDLADDVTEIASYAIYGNPYLTTLIINSETAVTAQTNAFGANNTNLTVYVSSLTADSYTDWTIPYAVLQVEMEGFVLTRLSGERYTLSGYTGSDATLIIDGAITALDKTYRIESIAKNAFLNNMRVTSVTVGAGIKEIGEYAFSGCKNLESVILSDNVLSVGAHAFDSCTALTDVSFNDELTSIEQYAFANCSSLTAVNLPEELIRIGIFAFANNSVLNEINFGSKLKEIGDSAFENASALISVRLPSAVNKLNDYVFRNCDNLTFLYMDAVEAPTLKSGNALAGTSSSLKIFVSEVSVKAYRTEPYWRAYANRILSYNDVSSEAGFENYVLTLTAPGKYRLVCYLGGEADVVINTNVNGTGTITEIGEYCFSHFAVNVTLSEGVEIIARNAFINAVSLNSVVLPDSLTSIGESAFHGLNQLQTVTINDKAALKEIGDYAFYDCSSLTSLSLPAYLTRLGKYALSGSAMNLEVLTFNGLPTVVLEIHDYAIANNTKLYELNFNCAVSYLGDGAFSGCAALNSIYLNSTGNRVAEIPSGALHVFAGCDQVSVFVPSEASLRNYLARWRNQFDKNRLFISSNISTDYYNSDGLLVEQSGFVISPLSGSSNLAAIVNYIGEKTEVVFPSSVVINGTSYQIERLGRDENNSGDFVNGRIIGDHVTKITIPNSVRSISSDAFRGAVSLTEVTYAEGSMLETIGNYAFAECPRLTTVNLPKSLSNITRYAFYSCTALTTVTFQNYQTGEILRTDLNIGQNAFENCSALTSIRLPEYTASISQYAFFNDINLREVILPTDGSLGNIGAYAFAFTGITDINIPASVGSVGEYAFSDCSKLRYVRLNRVTGSEYTNLTNAPNNVFHNVNSPFVKVYVPERSYTSYRDSTGWSTKTVIPDLTHGDFNYRLNAISGNYITLTNYLGNDKNPIIPSSLTIFGTIYNITTIAPYFGNEKIEEVTFAENSHITTLESYAFAGCSSLRKIHLPSAIQNMGDNVFYECTSLWDVRLPALLNAIPDYTFYGCTSLREIKVPSLVTSIGNSAFLNCSSLNRVEIEFRDTCSLGMSALVNTNPSLVIIVPNNRQGAFANEWRDFSDRIFDKQYVYGDFVVETNGTDFTLVQYNGGAVLLDLTELVIDGKKITAVAEDAIINENTTVILPA